MNDRAPYLSPPPDAEGPYQYYLVHEHRPVRVICDQQGVARGFETPDPMDGGGLKLNHLIARFIELGWQIESIARERFVELCRQAAAEKPRMLPPPEADGPYKYYLLGDTRPVRVEHDERGWRRGAHAPEIFEGGRLAYAALLSRLLWSSEVEDLTRDEFVELCRRRAMQYTRAVELPVTRPIHDLIPASLYDGIAGGDAERLAEARLVRQRELLAQLGARQRAAEAGGNAAEAAQVAYDLRRLRHLFQPPPPRAEEA